MSNRDKKLIYHLTLVENLAGIAEYGLLCRAELEARGMAYGDVANPDILANREQLALDQYVPFHFLPKNPFDYGVVHAHAGEPFVLLAVLRSDAAAQNWRVMPRPPLADHEKPEILGWREGLEAIDWHELDREDRDYLTTSVA